MENNKNNKLSYIILAFFAVAVIVLIFLNHFHYKDEIAKLESKGVEWHGQQEITNYDPTEYVALPGYDTFYFKADTLTQQVNIYNPEQNVCLMDMSLVLADETVIWQSGSVNPGYGFYEIELSQELPAGEYDARLNIECYTLDSGQRVNGGVMECKIIVNE